jgi:hypothetical protein
MLPSIVVVLFDSSQFIAASNQVPYLLTDWKVV